MSAPAMFFKSTKFAVVGASSDKSKFGNKLLRWYMDRKLEVVPINPVTFLPTLPTFKLLPIYRTVVLLKALTRYPIFLP